MRIAGGNPAATGANVIMFGSTHATAPGRLSLSTSGTGVIQFNTGAGPSEVMRLDSSGNLGIGTTSPNYLATLYKASLPILQLANSTSGSTAADGLLIYLNGANATISNEEAGALNFQTSGLLRATIDSSGNLGIGTSSPDSKLHVVSGASSTLAQLRIGFNGTSVNYYDANTHYFRDGSGPTNRMILDSSGNLGIGTSSPAAPLHVFANNGDMLRLDRNNTGAVGNQIAFRHSNAGTLTETASINAISTANADTGTLAFYTKPTGGSSTERARIDSSGNLLVGSTSSAETSGVGHKINTSVTAPWLATVGSVSTDANVSYSLYSTGAAAYRFYVGYGGTIFATSIVISAISDQRLKENVRDLETGLDSIMALKPRRFDWKEGKGQDKKDVAGFIAQEFETVFPECVGATKAGEDGIEYKNINHETLIPTLVKAIQEQQALINSLKARLDAANL
jgi:hypothetical protein